MDTVTVIVIALFAVGAVALWRQSKSKGRMGIDLSRKTCPRCQSALPRIRVPTSIDELLWGGVTCGSCGTKVDKYGREKV